MLPMAAVMNGTFDFQCVIEHCVIPITEYPIFPKCSTVVQFTIALPLRDRYTEQHRNNKSDDRMWTITHNFERTVTSTSDVVLDNNVNVFKFLLFRKHTIQF